MDVAGNVIQLNKAAEKLTGWTEKASLRARDLTMQLLTFSKGGKPVKKTILIKKLVKESAGFALTHLFDFDEQIFKISPILGFLKI